MLNACGTTGSGVQKPAIVKDASESERERTDHGVQRPTSEQNLEETANLSKNMIGYQSVVALDGMVLLQEEEEKQVLNHIHFIKLLSKVNNCWR